MSYNIEVKIVPTIFKKQGYDVRVISDGNLIREAHGKTWKQAMYEATHALALFDPKQGTCEEYVHPPTVTLTKVSGQWDFIVKSGNGRTLFSCPPTHATIKEAIEEVRSRYKGTLPDDTNIDLYECSIGSLKPPKFTDSYTLSELSHQIS